MSLILPCKHPVLLLCTLAGEEIFHLANRKRPAEQLRISLVSLHVEGPTTGQPFSAYAFSDNFCSQMGFKE